MFSFAVFLGGKKTCWRVCKRENFVQLVKYDGSFLIRPPKGISTHAHALKLILLNRKKANEMENTFWKSFIIIAFYDYFCLLLFCYFTVFNVILA